MILSQAQIPLDVSENNYFATYRLGLFEPDLELRS